MPTYRWLDKNTGKEGETFCDTIAEGEQYFNDNPHLEWLPSALGIVDPWRVGRAKPSEEFRSILKKIKKNNHGSDIDTY